MSSVAVIEIRMVSKGGDENIGPVEHWWEEAVSVTSKGAGMKNLDEQWGKDCPSGRILLCEYVPEISWGNPEILERFVGQKFGFLLVLWPHIHSQTVEFCGKLIPVIIRTLIWTLLYHHHHHHHYWHYWMLTRSQYWARSFKYITFNS